MQTYLLADDDDGEEDEWSGGFEPGETFVLPGNGMFPDIVI